MQQNPSRMIGVFFGSRSPEHDVSIITAELVIAGLRAIGYNVMPIYLSRDGDWYLGEELGTLGFFKDPSARTKLASLPQWKLNLDFSKQKLTFEKKGLFKSETVTIDTAFPCFHGPNGEDGTIQGLFEIANIPYVGCGVLTSALTMDKVLTKEIYVQHSVPTTDFVYFSLHEWKEFEGDITEQIHALGYPVFVKPSRAGSSIGITKVENPESLLDAIQVAFKFDQKVLVEKGVENLADLTVAVTGNYRNPESIRASLIQESRFSDDFFTYEEKYLNDGGAQLGATKNLLIPAEIDEKTTTTIQTMAKHIYSLFECTGTARVDFLYDRVDNKVYANEINTLPGTLYHHLWRESGVSLGELLRDLLRLAEEAHRDKRSLTYTFSSDILKHVGEGKLSRKIQ